MITFNSKADTTITGLYVKDIKRPVLPALDNTILTGKGITGAYDFGVTFGPREPIEVTFGLKAATQAALQTTMTDIANWLDPTLGIKQLTFDDEPGKIYFARIKDHSTPDQVWLYNEFKVVFTCPDPFKYSSTPKTVNFASNAAAAANTGKASTPPSFSITFTAAANEIKISLGTKYIRVVKAFIVGDVLTIDHKTGAILLNGVRAITYLDWINSEFFLLDPGTNNLSVTPINVATISVTYTERGL